MKIFFKTLASIFTLLFIWAAVLQSNDPDALKWYVIYGSGAFASTLFVFDQLRVFWAILLFGFYLSFAIYNWPAKFEGFTIGEGDIVNVEKAREVGGLLILALMMLVYGLAYKAPKNLKV